MVRENILEFERKHSQNLIELNEWLERTKRESEKEPKVSSPVDEKLEEAWSKTPFLEKSQLYQETGKLWDSDPLYKKINLSSFEDMAHLKVLAVYLTKQELKERLTYENYMLLETEVIIDNYLIEVENKKVRNRIYQIRRELKEWEKKLTKPTLEDKVKAIVDHFTK